MCDQNNLKDQYFPNLKPKRLLCDQNKLTDRTATNLKLKRPIVVLTV
jgi:hypothetical protein